MLSAANVDAPNGLATWNGSEWVYREEDDLQNTVVYDAVAEEWQQHDGSGWTSFNLNVIQEVQEEGVAVTPRSKINFIGTSVTAADDAGNARTNITITGGTSRLLFEFGDGESSSSLVVNQTSRFPNVPAGTIIKSRIEGDTTGSAVVDIQTSTADPPSYSSICASAKPTLSSDAFAEDSTLTGWTTTITEGTKVRAVLQSVSGMKQVTVVLTIQRT
jgi:hypothetical protein